MLVSPPIPLSYSLERTTATLPHGIRPTAIATQPTSWIRHKGQLAPEHLRLTADTPHAGYLVLHLRNYAAWKVGVNGEIVALGASPLYASLPRRDDGLMVVPVPQGPVRLDVDWTITGDVIMGRLLSLISLGCITVLCLIERKLAAARRVHAEPRLS